ncbi:MAG: hypothetical protein DRR16_14925 [Candidatus Parabeggiatoa sp. nov. 3]|nr:MAG: hypothetical protein DRR00_12445 [Gammaproteobacteria bacterium]RKZ68187.1 MAG: hypothetical protein DRQ99_04455 [Gammaproteobacteria bacterium]RKZ84342.1 MAG: hypothetical protein DRR16_14925 [Gammaproteobacteria bacterium]
MRGGLAQHLGRRGNPLWLPYLKDQLNNYTLRNEDSIKPDMKPLNLTGLLDKNFSLELIDN